MYRITILRRLALAAMLLAFCVVVFGAYVRLTDAGLGCPDWPGCYGHVTPVGAAAAASDGTDAATAQAPLHVGKAWREMIHRYGASTLGLIIVVNAVLTFLWRRQVGVSPGLPMALVVLVIFQGLLGMWTVTLLLKPLIVTLHLVFGLTTLSMLWWLWLSLRRRSSGPWAGGTSSAGGGLHSALVRPAPMGVRRAALIGAGRAGAADHARRLDQHQLFRRRLPGFPQVPGRLVARGRLQGCLRAVARARHQLRGRRAAASGARGHPFHASAGRDRGDARAAVRRHRRAARAATRCTPAGRRWPCCWRWRCSWSSASRW